MVFKDFIGSKLLLISSLYPIKKDAVPPLLGVDGCYLGFLET
jgi:hypothetical protein